jgi:uncharacterized protein
LTKITGLRLAAATGPVLFMIMITLFMISPVWAGGPSFNCEGSGLNSVEQLVCQTPELARLDRKLALVYAQALDKAVNEHPPVLRAKQRGWIKDRDTCEKSADAQTCIREHYRRRIAGLQALYRLVEFRGPLFFGCDGNPANEVVLTFFATEPETLMVEHGDRMFLLFKDTTLENDTYKGSNESVTIHEDRADVFLGIRGKAMACELKREP